MVHRFEEMTYLSVKKRRGIQNVFIRTEKNLQHKVYLQLGENFP